MDGGVFGLLGLIASHRGAVEYDWRHRFGLGLDSLGEGMTLAEAGRLAMILRSDPSSAIAAALEGWTHPIDRQTLALLDLFDLTAAINSKKTPKPHTGRPWKQQAGRSLSRSGNAGSRSNEQVAAILAAHGH